MTGFPRGPTLVTSITDPARASVKDFPYHEITGCFSLHVQVCVSVSSRGAESRGSRDLVAAGIYDEYLVGSSIQPIYTSCFL